MKDFNKKIFFLIPIFITISLQYFFTKFGPLSWFPFALKFHGDLGLHAMLIQRRSLQSFLQYPVIFHFPLSILNLSFDKLLITLSIIMYLLLALNMYLFMRLSKSDLANIIFAVNPFFPLLVMAGAYSQLVSISIILFYFMTENKTVKIILLGALVYGYPLAMAVIAPVTLIKKEFKVLSSAFVLSTPYIYFAMFKINEVMYLAKYVNMDTPPFFFETQIWSQPTINFFIFVLIPIFIIGLSLSALIERDHVSTSLISISIILWILFGLSTGMGMYFIYKVIYYLPISLADISYDKRFFGRPEILFA